MKSAKVLNNHRICYHRDNTILELIEKFVVLDTRQIHQLVTKHQKSGYKIVQRRLLRLWQQRRVRRTFVAKDAPYVYYVATRKPKQLEHRLTTNWGYIYIRNNLLRSYERITKFEIEDDYGVLRADGFCTIKNEFTNNYRFLFVESDISNNRFDKVKKYNKFYGNNGYKVKAWHKIAQRFPPVLVITHRPKAVKDKVNVDNAHGLEFLVVGLQDIFDK